MTAEAQLEAKMKPPYCSASTMRQAIRVRFMKAFTALDGFRSFVSMGAAFVAGLLASGAAAVAQSEAESQPNYEVRSTGDRYQDKALTVSLEGRELIIELPLEAGHFPFEIKWTGDFDRNGFRDAIVHVGNGSNCCPSEFFLVRYLGDRFFSLANDVAISSGWQGYSLIELEGELVIRVADYDLGVDQTEGREWMQDYALRDGKLVNTAKHVNVAKLQADTELTAEIVRNAGGNGRMSIDVDGDDALDQIQCSYWQRWGALSCAVQLSSGAAVQVPACERIGILPSRTDGWVDLVCGRRTVLTHNSGEYRAKND